MNYKPGDIVIAKLSFSETKTSNAKLRPTLVISSESHNKIRKDLVLLKISSVSLHDDRWEVNILPSKRTGLAKPSKVVCDNVKTVYKKDVRLIGRVDQLTLNRVRKKLSLLFGI